MPSSTYSPQLQKDLLRLAREALTRAVQLGQPFRPELDDATLRERKGCFVTLTKHGQLRGCIGNIYPEMPLGEAIAFNAYRAALKDPRFSPVVVDELSDIAIEISVLTVPEPLEYTSPEDLLAKLRPHIDGVVLESGSRRSTFLPQVWDHLPLPIDFLTHLSTKAGLTRDGWRERQAVVHVYRAEAFAESKPREGAER